VSGWQAEQRRLWHPVSRVLHIASAGEADERLTVSEPYGNPTFRRVDPLNTVFLAKPGVSLIEDCERVIVYNVQEGVLHLRQSEELCRRPQHVRYLRLVQPDQLSRLRREGVGRRGISGRGRGRSGEGESRAGGWHRRCRLSPCQHPHSQRPALARRSPGAVYAWFIADTLAPTENRVIGAGGVGGSAVRSAVMSRPGGSQMILGYARPVLLPRPAQQPDADIALRGEGGRGRSRQAAGVLGIPARRSKRTSAAACPCTNMNAMNTLAGSVLVSPDHGRRLLKLRGTPGMPR
jgi:hypothetical protein